MKLYRMADMKKIAKKELRKLIKEKLSNTESVANPCIKFDFDVRRTLTVKDHKLCQERYILTFIYAEDLTIGFKIGNVREAL
jgi:hypothetical protein